MDENEIIPEISNYNDLLKKFEYDLERYSKNNHSYELIDCIMSLNALPEWIKNSENASSNLKQIAIEKDEIMKSSRSFNKELIQTNLDEQLKFIRLFCNHSKHKTDSEVIPRIVSEYGGTLPAVLPIKLYNYIALGENMYDAEYLIRNIYNFWKEQIQINNNEI